MVESILGWTERASRWLTRPAGELSECPTNVEAYLQLVDDLN